MSQIIVGKVYANWCGHCQELIPKWAALKQNMAKSNIEFVEFEEAEVDKRNEFEAKHTPLEVNGYPTIFKIHPGKPVEYYNGSRTTEDMKQWILPSKKPFSHSIKKKSRKPKRKGGKKTRSQRKKSWIFF